MHIRKMPIPQYGGRLWVVVSDNIRKSIDAVEDMISASVHMKYGSKNYVAYTYADEDELKRQRIILFFKHNVEPPEMFHEIKHAVNIIFLDKGVRLSTTNDEPECYYVQNITRKVCNVIKQYKKKYKSNVRNTIHGGIRRDGSHGHALDDVPNSSREPQVV